MLRWLHRRRFYNQATVDRTGWLHDRPAADWRIRLLAVALAVGSIVQLLVGPSPTSITATFAHPAALSVGLLTCISAALILYAGECRSQWMSFKTEACGCGGFAAASAIQLWQLVATNPHWLGTQTVWWLLGWIAGCAARGAILFWRTW